MEKPEVEDELIKLCEELVLVMEQAKKIRREDVPSNLIFEIHGMTKNNMSKIFSEAAGYINPEIADTLLEKGLIQGVSLADNKKYSLTFKGIAQCVQIRYGNSLADQFLKFLELSDQKFSTTEQTLLSWKEKLACLSLILLASTSASSAIRLDDDANKAVLDEIFNANLLVLKKYKMVDEKEELRTVSRGEAPVSALMSRLNTLARKTNHYYKFLGKGSEYYLDIEIDGEIIERRLFFLLNRIFETYDPHCNYEDLYRDLSKISQQYYPKFRGRSVNSMIVLSILRKMKDFMSREILHLPPALKPTAEPTV